MAKSNTLLMRISLPAEHHDEVGLPFGYNFAPFVPSIHAAKARSLLNLAYQNGGGDVLTWEDWWPKLVADPEYDQELCFVVIDLHTSNIVAFAQCWNTGFIKDIAVHPGTQRRGLGQALMSHIFQTLDDRGLEHCSLKVRSDNPSNAATFYRSIGMEIVS
ncbi:MAG: N-acetyltransferase [Henriciella sp.]